MSSIEGGDPPANGAAPKPASDGAVRRTDDELIVSIEYSSTGKRQITPKRLAKNRAKAGPRPVNFDDLEQMVDWGETRWPECRFCGPYEHPELRVVEVDPRRSHIALYCPTCLSFGAFAPQKRSFEVADEETRKQTYFRYLKEAAGAGHKLTQAYYRHLKRYGTKPPWAWRDEWLAQNGLGPGVAP